MNRKIKGIFLASLPFLFILISWQILHHFNLFPKWLLPSPLETASTFWRLATDGTLASLILISATNAIPAFVFALVCAVALGTLIGMNTTIKKIFFPFLSAIYPIPSLAWLPLIIILLGFTRESIWCVIFISAFMKIIYNVIGGVEGVKQSWILAARNLGFKNTNLVFKVILPGAFPHIMVGIRLGFGSSWKSLVGAEMLSIIVGGLGKFIWMSQWFFSFDKVLVGIIIIASIGLFVEKIAFGFVERITITKWGLVRESV